MPAWGTGAGPGVLAAAGEDPEWPCVQRLVPEIAPAVIWARPPMNSVAAEPSPAIDQLAGELAARRVPLAEAETQIDAFADTLAPEHKAEQLAPVRPHAGDHQSRPQLDHPGIKKYARGERTLAEAITEKNERLSGLPADQVLARETLIAERDWDLRIYDNRRSSLPYLCEQPVLREQRAFALARTIASHLECDRCIVA